MNYESEGVATLDTWKQSGLSQMLFPYVEEIITQHMTYRDQLLDDIGQGNYDVVVETQYLYFTREDLEEKYDLLNTYELKSGTVTYWMDVWRRR